ncbi:MAG TPA: nuclear transport factor 2 family protein [Kofleriaceae bacterium]
MDTAILAANEAFYDAFRREDPIAMNEIWARRAPVGCIHPGWDALFGRDRVMASWRAIMENGAFPIRCVGPRVQRFGDTALVICEEHLGGGRLIATNVFVREDERWRMVHHHAGPIAAGEQDAEPLADPHGPN